MHRRILFGVAAWLLGAATATAGSLLAISLLGQDITGNSGQLLTQDAVNRALASEAAEASSATQDPDPPATPSAATPSATAPSAATPSAVSTSPAPAPTPAATTTTTAASSPGGTVLTSSGGVVVADCQAAGAYLISWSPSQGYEVSGVSRGPAVRARVMFASNANRVTMVVSCSTGVPTASSYTGGGGDE